MPTLTTCTHSHSHKLHLYTNMLPFTLIQHPRIYSHLHTHIYLQLHLSSHMLMHSNSHSHTHTYTPVTYTHTCISTPQKHSHTYIHIFYLYSLWRTLLQLEWNPLELFSLNFTAWAVRGSYHCYIISPVLICVFLQRILWAFCCKIKILKLLYTSEYYT